MGVLDIVKRLAIPGAAFNNDDEVDKKVRDLTNKRDKTREEQAELAQLISAQRQATAESREDPEVQALRDRTNAADQQDAFTAWQTGANRENYSGQLDQLTGQQRDLTNNAAGAEQANLNEYRGKLDESDYYDASRQGQFDQTLGSISDPLRQSAKWGGDLSSNGGDVAAQNQARGVMQDAAAGGLDARADGTAINTQRQLASTLRGVGQGDLSTVADSESVARQGRAANALEGYGAGGLDVAADPESAAAQRSASNTLANYGKGGLDVAADAESIGAQKNALSQLGALTSPQETAEEGFLREKARGEQFRQEKASRDAVDRQMESQGMGMSGLRLANMRSASQQNSQNRLLSDLGANAQASQRATGALAKYGDLAGDIRSASAAEGTANANRSLGAEQAAAAQANTLRDDYASEGAANASRRLGATQSAGDLASGMRDQSASMDAANANRQLSGINSATDLASGMRSSAYNEAAGNSDRRLDAAGAAGGLASQQRNQGDALSQFNRSESLAQQNLADTFAASERDKQAERAKLGLEEGRSTTAGIDARAGDRNAAGVAAGAAGYARGQDAITTEGKAAQAKYGLTDDWLKDRQADGQNQFDRQKDVFDASRGVTQDILGVQDQEGARQQKSLEDKAADQESDAATAEARRKSGGLLPW